MDIDAWLSNLGKPVASGDLMSPEALRLVAFVERYARDVATLIEVRRGAERDLVVLDFKTARPQRSAYPIKRTERIGIRFLDVGDMPLVYMLRADFPDTPHQQLVLEGNPRAICIDDRPWDEARLTWTPADLIHRILSWFSRAASGELHDARQPIDPQMLGSNLSFIVSRETLHRASELDLIAEHDTNHHDVVRVRTTEEFRGPRDNVEPICIVAYRVPPEDMQRMSFAPYNLGSLADMLVRRGIDLFEDLRVLFGGWLAQESPSVWRINARFAVIVEMPIVSPTGEQEDGTDLRAYVTDKSVGELAVALGVALRASTDQGSRVGYVAPLTPGVIDNEAVREIIAQSAEVHYEFDRLLATQLAGRAQIDERHAVVVGAGAIGSHVSECLAREGRFRWTVIDNDRLLPHNLARHTGLSDDVTMDKAPFLASRLSQTIQSTTMPALAITASVMTDGNKREDIDQALEKADLIIDATASLPAARYLSDHSATARRMSVFYSPAGRAVVLLAEPEDRSVTLRELEAQYLGLVARDAKLADHLAPPEGEHAYTGACRAITNRIPESRAMALSGLAATGLGNAADRAEGVIKICSLSETGGIDVHELAPNPVSRFGTEDWTVSIDQGLVERIQAIRRDHLPDETGGVLTGIVDIPAKLIHLANATPAPPDSTSSRGGFVRGTSGVQAHLDGVSDKTLGQVRYVGEWHSHPPRAAALPSATDLLQIDWLATLFDMDTLPALMLIAGDGHVGLVLANHQAKLLEGEPHFRGESGIGRRA